jgi:hypothetical protein
MLRHAGLQACRASTSIAKGYCLMRQTPPPGVDAALCSAYKHVGPAAAQTLEACGTYLEQVHSLLILKQPTDTTDLHRHIHTCSSSTGCVSNPGRKVRVCSDLRDSQHLQVSW